MKIEKILIANRAEIAVRIIRCCKKLSIKSFAVCTSDEKQSLWTKEADQFAILESKIGYLDQELLIKLAKKNGCQAIHPGYGFLSENPDFANKVKKAGLIFIGPEASAIKKLGDKVSARNIAAKLSIPILAGITINRNHTKELTKSAEKLGFPLVVKAAMAGGGRGMRIVKNKGELLKQIESASREAQALFNDQTVYLEKYLVKARHIEVQIVADKFGNVFDLYDRECSIQRSYQKIIEEAPADNISSRVRSKLYSAAKELCGYARYTSLATVEFLVDQKENFYLLEVNTRLQVEHPVTEQATSLDLVELQIRVAEGADLSNLSIPKFEDLKHSIEVRVCAEASEDDLVPQPGVIKSLNLPKNLNLRLETGYEKQNRVSSSYDSLVAKIISTADSRSESLSHLITGLKQFELTGIRTNTSLLLTILESSSFREATYSLLTFKEILKQLSDNNFYLDLAAAFYGITKIRALNLNQLAWRLVGKASKAFEFTINNRTFRTEFTFLDQKNLSINLIDPDNNKQSYKLQINQLSSKTAEITLESKKYNLSWHNDDATYLNFGYGYFEIRDSLCGTSSRQQKISALESKRDSVKIEVKSPLPAKIVAVHVKKGAQIKKGSLLITIESMKMEHQIQASADGKLTELLAKEGESVIAGQTLAKMS